MDQWLNELNNWLATHPGWISAAIAATALVESLAIAGLFVPGVAMLFVIAVVAGNHDLSVWLVMGWACIGAILGDGISFWIGRHFQGRLAGVWPFRRYPTSLYRGEDFFRKHGGKSVVLGRFIGPIRPIIPMIAGALAMDGRRFFAFNLLSALGWAPLYLLPGYLVGASLGQDLDLPPHFYPALIVTLIILGSALAVFFRLHLGMLPRGGLYDAVETLLERYPRVWRLWCAMARPRGKHREFPLPSLALAVIATCAFIILTLSVIHTDWLEAFNILVMEFFQILRLPLLDPGFIAITLSGDALLLGAGFVLFGCALFAGGFRAAALHVFVAGTLVAVLTAALKYGLYLARPETVDLPPVSPAYPSGHSSGVTVFYGLIAAFVAQEFPRHRRWHIYGLAAVPIFAVALSRLYLGVHWFTDTLGGILLGLAICGAVRVSFSRHDWHRLPLRLPLAGCLAVWLLLVAAYAAVRWDEAVASYTPLAL